MACKQGVHRGKWQGCHIDVGHAKRNWLEEQGDKMNDIVGHVFKQLIFALYTTISSNIPFKSGYFTLA
jgi:hypothetical protein